MKRKMLIWFLTAAMCVSSSIPAFAVASESTMVAQEEGQTLSPVSDGRNLDNLDFKFQTVDGEEVTSTATNGRPKVLIFFNDTCPISQNVMSELKNSIGTENGTWLEEGKADVYAIESTHCDKQYVLDFASRYVPEGYITMCYNDLNYGANFYAGLLAGTETARAGFPFFVMIDANNKVQYATNGYVSPYYIATQMEKILSVVPEETSSYSVIIEVEGEGKVEASALSAVPGTKVTLNPQPETGYEFVEWKVLEGNVSVEENEFTMPEVKVKIQAVFREIVEGDGKEEEKEQEPEEGDEVLENQNTEKKIYLSDGDVMVDLYSGEYLANHRIPIQSYECTQENPYNLEAAFDDSWTSQWSSQSQGEVGLTVTFETPQKVSRILYGLRNNLYDPDGYPTKLRIEVSTEETGENFQVVGRATSDPTLKKVVFHLEEAVEAKRVRFVIEEANGGFAKVGELIFLEEDAVMSEIERVFENEELRQLREEYKDDAELDRLEKALENHEARTYLLPKIRLAKQVLTGEVKAEDPLDFPVRVIQKTGPDAESYNILVVPERFNIEEQDAYYEDIRNQMNQMLETYEPYREMADRINIYALEIPSNERYSSFKPNALSVDSYFESLIGRSGSGGSASLTQNGREKLIQIRKQVEDHYLERGGKWAVIDMPVNSYEYAGTAHPDTVPYSMQTNLESYAPYLMYHEFSHSVGGLGDEYPSSHTIECKNVTTKSDPKEAPWSEFMYFRGVTHDMIQSGAYSASAICQMGADYNYRAEFCEWCNLLVFEAINKKLGQEQKEDLYVAKPVFTIDHTETSSGFDVTKDNTTNANGKSVRFRTVVKNLTDTPMNLKMEMYVEDASGTEKTIKAQNYTVSGGEIKSISVDSDVFQDLQTSDEILGRIINTDTNQVLVDTETYLVPETYTNVQVNFRLGTPGEEQELEDVSDYELNLQVGNSVNLDPITLKGYEHQEVVAVKADSEEEITAPYQVSAGEKIIITHYYTKNKKQVTLRLTNGEKTEDRVRYVNKGESFYPSQSDFPKKAGYYLQLPQVISFDAIGENQVLEYTYIQGENPGQDPIPPKAPTPSIPQENILEEVVYQGDQIDLTDNIYQMPRGAKLEILDEVDNSMIRTYSVSAKVTFSDGTIQNIEIPVVVKSKNPQENVESIPVTSVELDQQQVTVEVGQTVMLKERVLPANASNAKVTWASSAAEIAKVENGVVTAVSKGTAVITVTTEDGKKTASCTVTVTDKETPQPPQPEEVAVESVVLDKTEAELKVGENTTLTATVLPAEATNQTVSWASDKPGIAKVEDGVVTAVSKGTAVITVTTEDGKKTARCTVTVTDKETPQPPQPEEVAVESVVLDKTEAELKVGENTTLTATVLPEEATNQAVSWTSDQQDIAKVEDGVVTAVSKGTAVITVTTEDGGKTATCTVTVTEVEVEPDQGEGGNSSDNPQEGENSGTQQKPEGEENQGTQQKPEGEENQGTQQKPEGEEKPGSQQKPGTEENSGIQQKPGIEENSGIQQQTEAEKKAVEEARTAILPLLEEAKSKKAELYTAKSWSAYQTALTNLQLVMAQSGSTSLQLTQAKEQLQKAVQGLEEISTPSIPKKGTILKVKDASYRVTKEGSKNGEVSFVKTTAKGKTIQIPATIKKDGITYKVTAVEKNALKKNQTASKVVVGKNVKTIGDHAFGNCKTLTSVTIGKNVTKLGKNVFKGSKKLKTILLKTTKLKAKGLTKNSFAGIGKTTKIKAPKKSLKTYQKLLRTKGLGKGVKVTK